MPSQSHRRLLLTTILSGAVIAASPALAQTLPSGGKVTSGSAVIATAGTSTTIAQSSGKAILTWNDFSIGQGDSVRFNNGSGATLNRVTGGNLSSIDGLLSATGSVYLINPNGVVIGKSGVVKTGGSFVASTLDVGDSSFLSGGDLSFSGHSTASVVNLGSIGSLGGNVVLIGSTVENDGSVTAANGTAGLVAGQTVLMKDTATDQGLFTVQVGGADTSITNTGTIAAASAELRANGGSIYALAGNTTGIITATGVGAQDGHIWLTAGNAGTLSVDETLKATQADGDGGTVETSAGTVDFNGVKVDTTGITGKTGSWLVDPYDLTVDASAASTISSNLATTNVTLQTTASGTSGPGTANASGVGDINIDSAITWSSGNTLTLDAYHGINILAPITVAGAGGVVIKTNDGGTGGDYSFGLASTGNFAGNLSFTGTPGAGQSLTINGSAYTLIYSLSGLAAQTGTTTNLALANSINASGTTYGAAVVGSLAGNFEGLGHTVSNLTIAGTGSDLGLIGTTSGTVRDVAMTSASITGGSNSDDLGALVGYSSGSGPVPGSLTHVYASGTVSGGTYASEVGGIVGDMLIGIITDAHSDAVVSGFYAVGGLVGWTQGNIYNSSATGAITLIGTSSLYAGGLAGNAGEIISGSYATGNVNGGTTGDNVGGLAGGLGAAVNSYATGNVTGAKWVGGLIGYEQVGGTTNAYATGNVTGTTAVGGLAGYAGSSSLTGSYASGTVTGTSEVGGLVGQGNNNTYTNDTFTGQLYATSQFGGLLGSSDTDTITNSFYDINTSLINGTPTVTVGGIYNAQYQDWSSHGMSLNIANYFGSVDANGYYDIGSLAALESLLGFEGQSGLKFKLTADIDLSSAPGFYLPYFNSAVFDGGGHVISNLAIDANADNVGLFGYVNGGTISNLGVMNGYVQGIYYVGGLAGQSASGSQFTNDYSTISVSGNEYVGGLVGVLAGTVTNAYATGNVYGVNYLGGLVGNLDGTVTDAYATGVVASNATNAGGLVGQVYSGSITGGYYDAQTSGQASGAQSNGSIGIATAAFGSASTFAGWTFTATAGGNGWVIVDTDGTLNNASGAAGATRPMLASEYETTVTNGHQLQLMAMNLAANYVQAQNIDLSGTQSTSGLWITLAGFAPIGSQATPFSGSLNGGGYVIDGLTMTTYDADAGLIGYNTGTLTDVALSNVSVNSAAYATGALAGWNTGTISDSYSTGLVTGYATAMGGLVGWNQGGTISNVYSSADVEDLASASHVGGLMGVNYGGNLSYAYALGLVRGNGFSLGGLIGYNSGTVQQTYAANSVSGAATYQGDLVGYSSGTFGSSYYIDYVNDGQTPNPSRAAGAGSVSAQGIYGSYLSPLAFPNFHFTNTPGGTGWVLVADDGAINTETNGDLSATLPMLASEYSTLVNNGHQLELVNMAKSASYTLGGDIDLGATNIYFQNTGYDIWWGQGFATIGTAAQPFTGSFNGDGHTISNLYIGKYLSLTDSGLFGYNTGAIYDLSLTSTYNETSGGTSAGLLVGHNTGTLTNDHVSGGGVGQDTSYAGDLVGWNDGGTLSHDSATTTNGIDSAYYGGLVGYNTGTLTNDYASGEAEGYNSAYLGGLVGWNQGGTITQSYADMTLTSTQASTHVGGLVGVNAGTISDSYAIGNVSGDGYSLGGLVGYNTGGVSNSYAAGTVSGSATYAGGLIGYNPGTISDSFWDTTTSGQGAAVGTGSGAGATGLTTTQFLSPSSFSGWTFVSTPGQSGWVIVDAYGSVNNLDGALGATLPMLASEYSTTISNGHQLQLIALNLSGSYTLADDLTAGGSGDVWTTSEGFSALGAGTYAFSGSLNGNGHTIDLTLNGSGNYAGLFGQNTGLITGVTVNATIGGSSAYATGGLAGSNSGFLIGDTVTGSLGSSGDHLGGAVGVNNGMIFYTTVNASLGGSAYSTGELAGWNAGEIVDGTAAGTVSGSSQVAGGIAGYNAETIFDSSASTAVSGSGQAVGGLVGWNDSEIVSDSASGAVSGSANHAGGLVGVNMGNIDYSHASGAVSGATVDEGGLVGWNNYQVFGDYATGAVSGSAGAAGGLVGWNQVEETFSWGSIGGTITEAFATGSVGSTNSQSHVGGLVGASLTGTYVSYAYAQGSVMGSGYSAGGLIGYDSGNVTQVYSTGAVLGSATYRGGLFGYDTVAATDSYWDTQASGMSTVTGFGPTDASTTGMTTSALKSALPTGFDSSWSLTPGQYPYIAALGSH